MKRALAVVATIAGLMVYLYAPVALQGQAPRASARSGAAVEIAPAVHHDVSPPLREIPIERHPRPLHVHPVVPIPHAVAVDQSDPVLQTSVPTPSLPVTPGLNFDGLGVGFPLFAPDAAPPDTNGAVGATQYVQWVNESFAVFDKTTGNRILGPVPGNTLWQGFGGGCETNNDGDPIAQYDKLANRWVMTQFSVSTLPYLQCVAVSTTPDATGTYARYAFQYTNFPDYAKLGVWPDAYYVSFNMFSFTFLGARICAYDRLMMLAGLPATQQCFQLTSSFGGLLPSDLDGPLSPPPAGAPNYFVNFGSNSLNLWRFHVDFIAPGNTMLTGPINIPVAAFSPACNGGACVPQLGTRQKLDSLGDRLMYRLAYRNVPLGVETLVVNHAIAAGARKSRSTGVRWYELRNPAGTPTVFQQGTYAPDATFRWMGSAAMDKVGNIAIGYSVSSGKIHPGIRIAARAATDPPGTLGLEQSIIEGTGSQLRNLNRWGDYSALSVDPVDDCTFWYTNEYLKADGTFNWSTRIANFKLPGCS